MKRRLLLYLLLAVQVIGLCALYTFYQTGLGMPSVLLRTLPVDPRDLLRGDYMILNYEISSPPAGMVQSLGPVGYGESVYALLRKDPEGFAVINSLQLDEPPEGKLFIRGQLQSGRIIYDMEKYFVPEGMGTPVGTITVRAALRGNGQPQIKTVYLDGEPYP